MTVTFNPQAATDQTSKKPVSLTSNPTGRGGIEAESGTGPNSLQGRRTRLGGVLGDDHGIPNRLADEMSKWQLTKWPPGTDSGAFGELK
jgi:hypothetical protein